MPKGEKARKALGKKKVQAITERTWDPMTDYDRSSQSLSFYDFPQQREQGPNRGPS